MLDKLNEAKRFLISKFGTFPKTVVVMGSGMSSVLSEIEVEAEIGLGDIPHVPGVGVEGHSGRVIVGRLGGSRIAVSQGRIHFYEGHSMATVVFPFRAMGLAGADTFLLTNAAGGLRAEIPPKSLLLISDHLNLMGSNPLHGPNIAELGPRFPDMSYVYDPEIRSLFQDAAKKIGVPLLQGIYVGLQGPAYETPAEVRLYRQLGGDVVGMSTVPEAMALRHMGKRVAGISCVTNSAAGVSNELLTHAEVLENAKQVHSSLARLLKEVIVSLEHTNAK